MRNIEHHRVELIGNAEGTDLICKARGVFRSRQLLTEGVQAEARVDALVEDAAELAVALQNEDAVRAVPFGGDGGGKSRGASADDKNADLFHAQTSFVVPVSSWDAPPRLVSAVCGTPSSRLSSSMTRGAQKPP